MEDDRDPSAAAGGRKKWSIEDEAAAANHELAGDLPPGDAKVHDLTSHYRRSIATQSPVKGVNSATVGATPSGPMPPQFPFSVHAYDVTGGANANRAPPAPQGAPPRSHRATVAFTPSQVNSARNREFTASLSASATIPLPNVNLETTSGSGTKPQQSLHGSPYVTAVLLSLWDFSSGPRPEQVWVADPSGLKNSSSPAATASNTTALREEWQSNQVVDLADTTALVHPTPAAPYHIHITDHQFLGPKSTPDGISSQPKSESDPNTLIVPSGDQDVTSSASTIVRSTSPSSGSHTSQRDTTSSQEGNLSVTNPATLPLTVADHENLRGSFPSSGTISPPLPNTVPIIAPSTKVTKLMGGRRSAASDLDLAGSFGFDADEEDESPVISEMIDEDYVAKKNPGLKKALLAARLKNAPRVISSHPKHAKTNRFASATTDSLDYPSSPKAETLDTNILSESTDSHHAQDSTSKEQHDGPSELEHGDDSHTDARDRDEKRSASISSLGSLNASRRRSYSLTGDSSSRTTLRSNDVLNELDGDDEHFGDYPAHSSDDESDSDSSLYSSSSSDAWDDDEDDESGSNDGSSSSEASDHGPSTEESVFLSGDIMAIASHVAKYTLGSDLAELVSSSSLASPSPTAGGGIMMDPWNITSNNQSGHGEGNTPAAGDASHPVGSTLSNVFGGSDDGEFGFFGERTGSTTGGGGNMTQKRDGSGNGNGTDRNGGGGTQGGMGGGDPSDPNNDPNGASNMGAKMATGEDDNDAVNFLGIEHKLHVFESAPYFTISAVFTAPYNVKITGPTNSAGAPAAPGIASFVEGPMASLSSGNNSGAPTFAADPTKFAFSLLLPKDVYDTFTRHYAALIDRLNQWVVLYVYLCQLRPQQALPLIHKEVVRTVMQMNRLLGCEGISLPSLKNTLFALARPNSHDSTPGSFNSSTSTNHGLNASSSAIHSSHGSSNHPHMDSHARGGGVGSVDSRGGGFSPFSPPSSPMHSHPSNALPSQLNYMHADFMSGDESSMSVGTGPLGHSFSPSPFALDGPLTSPNSSFGDMPHFYGDGSAPTAALSDRQYRVSTSITSANSPHLGMSQHAPLSPRGAAPREFELPGHGSLSASSPAVPSGGAVPIPISVGERSGSATTYGKENVSSSTSWIDEPKKVREFLALILTSHFQTHQRTVILGEDLDMVNLFVSTLAVFLSPEDRAKSRLATFHNIPSHLGGKLSTPQRNRAPPSNTPDAPFVATFFPTTSGQGASLQASSPAVGGATPGGPPSGKLPSTNSSASTMTTLSTAGFGISAPVSRGFSSAQAPASAQTPNASNSSSQAPYIASINVPVTSAPSPSAADFRHLRRDARRDSVAPPVASSGTPSQASTPPVPNSGASGSQLTAAATQWHVIHQHFFMDGYVPDLILQGIHGNAKMVRNSAYIQGSMPVTLVDLNRRSVTQTHPFHQFRLLRCEFHQAVLYKLLRIKKTNLWNTQETLFQQVKDTSAIVRKLVIESMRLPEQLILPYISISLKNLMARTYTLVKYVEGLEQGSPGIIDEARQNLAAAAASGAANTSTNDGKGPASGKGSKDSGASGDKDKNRLPNSDKNSSGVLSGLPTVLAPPPVPSPCNAYYASGPALPSHSDPFADIHFNDSHASNPRYGSRSRSGSSSSASSAAPTPQAVHTPTLAATSTTEGAKPENLPSPHSYASLTSVFASPPPNLFHHHHHHLYQHNHAIYPSNAHGMALGEIRTNPSLLKRIRHDLDLDDSCFNVLLGLAELLKPGIFRALFGDPMSQEKKWIELFEGL